MHRILNSLDILNSSLNNIVRSFKTTCLIFILFFSLQLYADDPVEAKRLSRDIVFDGYPETEEWNGAPILNSYMFQPDPNGTPTEKTEILIAYTDDYLWIGGRFYDEAAELVKANTKKRDDFGDSYDFFARVASTVAGAGRGW